MHILTHSHEPFEELKSIQITGIIEYKYICARSNRVMFQMNLLGMNFIVAVPYLVYR